MSNHKGNKTGMPDWLLKLTEAKQGGFRKARYQRCPRCQEIVLHGMDADMVAGMATIDPAPITPQQEWWCAITGRPTYSLDIDPDRRVTINDRDRWSITKPHRNPIVAGHLCGQRYPGFLPELRKQPTAKGPQKPPF